MVCQDWACKNVNRSFKDDVQLMLLVTLLGGEHHVYICRLHVFD